MGATISKYELFLDVKETVNVHVDAAANTMEGALITGELRARSSAPAGSRCSTRWTSHWLDQNESNDGWAPFLVIQRAPGTDIDPADPMNMTFDLPSRHVFPLCHTPATVVSYTCELMHLPVTVAVLDAPAPNVKRWIVCNESPSDTDDDSAVRDLVCTIQFPLGTQNARTTASDGSVGGFRRGSGSATWKIAKLSRGATVTLECTSDAFRECPTLTLKFEFLTLTKRLRMRRARALRPDGRVLQATSWVRWETRAGIYQYRI